MSWKPPESDGGSKITSYIVEKCEARNPRWLRVARLPPGSLSVDCYNLIEGVDYFFSVAAENEAGVSSPLETEKPVTPKSKFGKGNMKQKIYTVRKYISFRRRAFVEDAAFIL